MSSAPFTDSQIRRVEHDVRNSRRNPVLVKICSGQSVEAFTRHLLGKQSQSGSPTRLVSIRVSNYLGNASRLLAEFETASKAADWVIVHIGGTICPEEFTDLMENVFRQQFGKPRIIFVTEDLDLAYGSPAHRRLFDLDTPVDLTTASREPGFYYELALKIADPLASRVVALHFRLQEAALPGDVTSLRRLEQAIFYRQHFPDHSFQRIVKSTYADRLRPDSPETETLTRIIDEIDDDAREA